MNARERILAAIDRQPVDRVPTDIWATSEVWTRLHAHFGPTREAVLEGLHIDGFAGFSPPYIGPPLPSGPNGESVNFWGMRHRRIGHAGGTYDEQTHYPLAFAETIDDLDRYPWPSVDWFDFSNLRAEAARVHATQAVQCGYMAPFFYHNLLRGLERSLMDPHDDPELTNEILRRISDFFYAYHRRLFESCEGLIDVAQVTDDLGSQTGPMIGLNLYRRFYAPHHQRFINLCREFGIRVFHHDDGSCRAFLPLLVDMGIDILNPIQWTCPGMALTELKAEFGHRICFHGAVDNQTILPFGTPDAVRAEVRHCIDALASDGTGYILAPCHNLQGNTPLENILAMYDEAWRHGRF